MPNIYKLIPIIDLDKENQIKVLRIRNEENVRKWMYTDHEILENEHFNWINKLKENNKMRVYVIMENGLEPVGVINIVDIDIIHKKANWGFYIGEKYQGTGIGVVLEILFLEYCFINFGLEKINCEVIEGNTSVIKLHKELLFQEEGFLRKNIIKNGERVGVYLLGLIKEEWDNNYIEIKQKYGNILKFFQITIGDNILKLRESETIVSITPPPKFYFVIINYICHVVEKTRHDG